MPVKVITRIVELLVYLIPRTKFGELLLSNLDGLQDRVIYNASGFGNDEVRQFEDGIDIIDVRNLNLASRFGDVTATQSAAATIITFAGVSGQINLASFTATDIDSGDFFFQERNCRSVLRRLSPVSHRNAASESMS